jgi:YtfJ family uncharacterized protein
MTMRMIITTLLLLLSTTTFAQLPVVGEMLSPISIDDQGSIELEGDDMVYQPWSTDMIRGKPVYLQHMAARSSTEGLNKKLDDALEARGYTPQQLGTVAIANKDDAVWGTGVFVAGQLKKNKKRYPDATIVVDSNGTALKHWGLQEKNVAVIILSAQGKVLFFRQGALEEAEVTEVLDILTEQVEG